jgi:hypothetical protein
MMPLIYSRHFMTGVPNGVLVQVTATESPGQIVHTVVVTGTDSIEQITGLAVCRATATSQPITVELGSTEAKDRYTNIMGPIGVTEGATAQSAIISKVRLTATTSIIRVYSTGTASGVFSFGGTINRATLATV